VLEKLMNDFIVVALYVDERTKLPENEWITSSIDGKVKNTVGKKNADLQISRFNVNSQPFYVILDSNEVLLTEPFGFNTNIDDFIAFLDMGIARFRQSNNDGSQSKNPITITLGN